MDPVEAETTLTYIALTLLPTHSGAWCCVQTGDARGSPLSQSVCATKVIIATMAFSSSMGQM